MALPQHAWQPTSAQLSNKQYKLLLLTHHGICKYQALLQIIVELSMTYPKRERTWIDDGISRSACLAAKTN